jgi:hypothetical protein
MAGFSYETARFTTPFGLDISAAGNFRRMNCNPPFLQ